MHATRHFATLGARQVHYRRLGAGPAALLLHQSPASSAELEPLMRQLAGDFTAIAPDMPGYGETDPLLDAHLSVAWLADQLAALMDELGIVDAAIYGFHTGASVALALARRHPTRVTVTVCDGLLCLDAAERTDFLRGYAPPFVPCADGSHLAWLWTRIKDQSLFFPWHERSAAARLAMDGTPYPVLAERAHDWLRSGEHYAQGYAAAIAYDPRDDLPGIHSPLHLLRRAADPLAQHVGRLEPLPRHVVVHDCNGAVDGYERVRRVFLDHAHGPAVPAARPPRPLPGVWQDYVNSMGVALRVLRSGTPRQPGAVVLHDAQSCVLACKEFVAGFGSGRAVAIEFPGHGASAAAHSVAADIAALAELQGAALRELGFGGCDLIGIGAGAAVQVELARQRPTLARSVTLIAALDVTREPALQAALERSYTALEADFHGGYLLRAWHEARDHLLFFPWYERRRAFAVADTPRLEAAFLHARTVERILAGAAGTELRRAELRYPLAATLRALGERGVPAQHAAPSWEPRAAHSRALADAQQRFVPLAAQPERWAAELGLYKSLENS